MLNSNSLNETEVLTSISTAIWQKQILIWSGSAYPLLDDRPEIPSILTNQQKFHAIFAATFSEPMPISFTKEDPI